MEIDIVGQAGAWQVKDKCEEEFCCLFAWGDGDVCSYLAPLVLGSCN